MKHMKTRTVPAKTEEYVDSITCDLCKAEIADNGSHVDEVEIRNKTGTAYYDIGFGEEVTVDMCGGCFRDKLLPWLLAQGAELSLRKWGW